MFYAPYASIVVWKLQNGAKTLVKLGAGQKLTCFDQLRKGCRFYNYCLTTIGPAHHTYNNFVSKFSSAAPTNTDDTTLPTSRIKYEHIIELTDAECKRGQVTPRPPLP